MGFVVGDLEFGGGLFGVGGLEEGGGGLVGDVADREADRDGLKGVLFFLHFGSELF